MMMMMTMGSVAAAAAAMQYEVYGHSGEGPSFVFVKSDMPPKNMKDRLDVLLASKLWLCHFYHFSILPAWTELTW